MNEDFKKPQIEDVQKSFDRAISIFSESVELNKIDIKEWLANFALYYMGKKAGISHKSLTNFGNELLGAQVINNRTDLDEAYTMARQLINDDTAIQKLNNYYDEKGMLKPELAWTDLQKKEIMGCNASMKPFLPEDEKPKILSPENSSLERGKALSRALSSDFETYKEGMQQRGDERYQSMIDELPPIEGPTSRKK